MSRLLIGHLPLKRTVGLSAYYDCDLLASTGKPRHVLIAPVDLQDLLKGVARGDVEEDDKGIAFLDPRIHWQE